MLEELATITIFHMLLVFCRLGSAMIAMPGFGEVYVSPQARLMLALAVSVAMAPLLEPHLPDLPTNTLSLFLLLFAEILIGLFIGALTRMIQAVLHIAGMIIAFQSSLAAAILFDANQGSQGSVIGNFMTLAGVTLIFTTDLHHVILGGIFDSYKLFTPGMLPPTGDLAKLATTVVSDGFLVAVKISSPLIVVGLCMYLAAGLMGRLMPNMQVFFVIIPLQIYVGFALLMITLAAGMMVYLNFFEDTISVFFVE